MFFRQTMLSVFQRTNLEVPPYWQGIAQEIAAGDRKANALAMIFSLKNQFPDDFRDRTENTTTVKHQFSEGFEDFLTKVTNERRANQASARIRLIRVNSYLCGSGQDASNTTRKI